MNSGKEVSGCLIERAGRYYAVVYYYVEDQRVTETKSTGIAVNEHKKREAEKIKNQLIAEKRAALEQPGQGKAAELHPVASCLERWVDYLLSGRLKGDASVRLKL